MDTKEYIINIRVSKAIYDKLKERAKENSETLSSLVRKTLDDSWEILGDIKDEILGKEGRSANLILHYQKVVVANKVACHRCNASLSKGGEAFLGETGLGMKRYFCGKCLSVG